MAHPAEIPAGLTRRRFIQGSTGVIAAGSAALRAGQAAAAPANRPVADRLAATWYNTWYLRTTTCDWRQGGPGTGSSHQLLGDVDGDGRDDGVVINDGRWYVARSDGSRFLDYEVWLEGLDDRASHYFLADVDGDGRADAIAFDMTTGTWTVALSTGHEFGEPSVWRRGLGAGAVDAMVADLNGDSKADAITWRSTGQWDIAPAVDGRFGRRRRWGSFGRGSSRRMVADVTGDGHLDAIVYYEDTSNWEVALSDGEKLGDPKMWIHGFGVDSPAQLMADTTGDGRADAITMEVDGSWWVARSDGTAFETIRPVKNILSGFGAGSDRQFYGNTYGPKDPTMALVTFTTASGSWQVQGYNQYKFKNRWEAWAQLNFRVPEVAPGVFRQYDTKETEVIDHHLKQMSDAGIDFIIMDETNKLHNDRNTILEGAFAVARRINAWNAAGRRPFRYAIGFGGEYNKNPEHDPAAVEAVAAEVHDLFVTDPEIGGDNYQMIDGKPLLVLYTWHLLRTTWQEYDDHASSDRFTVRFAEGWNYRGDYGWYNPPTGPVPDSEAMFITPRVTTLKNRGVGRGDISGDRVKTPERYIEAWEAVIEHKPRVVIAGAFAAFAENNEIAPVDTSGLPEHEQWINPETGKLDPYLYWNITTDYLEQFKQLR